MDWTLGLTHNPHSHPHEHDHGVYQDLLGMPDQVPPPSPESLRAASSAGSSTDRLLELQGQLHRLLWTVDNHPDANLVEESLEIVKVFIEILQSATKDLTAAQDSRNPTGELSATASQSTQGSANGGKRRQRSTRICMIAQQALTCYSCVLLVLDRVVRGMEPQETPNPGEETLPPSLQFGLFNLASQPELNVEVVVHLVLRMVFRLRGLIRDLVAGFAEGGVAGNAVEDVEVGSLSSQFSSPSTILVNGGPTSRKRQGDPTPSGSSIAATLLTVADLVSEEEKSLLDRMTCLGGSRL